MGWDRYMLHWFGAVHLRYRPPCRSILVLIPIAVSFAFTGLLDQVITFSILYWRYAGGFMIQAIALMDAYKVAVQRWKHWKAGQSTS